LPELVEDGHTGLLVEPTDPASLAAAMARLFDHPDLAAALRTAGRQRLESVFNQEIWLRKISDIFGSL
jgi:glycosyltransferase involved in cell wall biosynthesis